MLGSFFDAMIPYPSRKNLYLLIAITLGAFALRVIRLDFQPLWWDEGYSLFFATRDFATMLARTAIDIHPPLYYALLQLWIAFAGKSDVAARLLSVAIGIAAIPLVYALARKLFDDARVALIAACVLAVSPFHVYYSQEVRMYGLVTLLGLASVYFFVYLLDMPFGKPKTALVVGAYVFATAAALYAQYYAAFIVAFEIVVVIIVGIRNRRIPNSEFKIQNYLFHWLLAWFAIAALCLPWVIYAGEKLYTYVTGKVAHEAYAPQNPITFSLDYFTVLSVGHVSVKTLAIGTAVFVALALLGVIAHRIRAHEDEYVEEDFDDGDTAVEFTDNIANEPASHADFAPRWIALLYLIVPVALAYLVNLRFPFHPPRVERLLLLAAPAFYLLVALGIAALWERRAAMGIGALILVAAVSGASLYDFYTMPRYPQDDYRPLIDELQTLAQKDDVFLAIYPWQIGYLESYYAGAPLKFIETPNDAWINNPAQMQTELDARLPKNSRVWLPGLQTLGRIIEDALDTNFRARAYSVMDEWYGTTRLELFAFADDPAPSERPLAIGDVRFNAWGISSDPIPADNGIARIWLDAPDTDNLKQSLRLVDANGNVWAQNDRELVTGMQHIGLAIPLGVPSGAYTLRMNLYRGNQVNLTAINATLGSIQIVAPIKSNLAAIPQRAALDFETGFRLIGYDTLPVFHPGESTPLTLFWQSLEKPRADSLVVVQVQDERGNVFASTQATLARGIYQPQEWSGEIIRDPQTLTLRGDTADGTYRLVVGWLDPQTNIRTPLREITPITVKGRTHYFGVPSPAQKFDARFGEVARLVGYDVSQAERNVRVVLYWQSLAPTQTSYTAFVHLLDESGAIRAQRDQIPGAGAYPTTSWVKGEYMVDVYDISIPRDAPLGEYKIEIGMYDANARLSVFNVTNQSVGDYSELPTRIPIAP